MNEHHRTHRPARSTCVAAALLLLGAASCRGPSVPVDSVRQELATANTQSTQADRNPDTPNAGPAKPAGRPVARVNGSPIPRRDLIDLLLRTRGLGLLQQMILCEAAVQETRRLNLDLTPADIDREYDLTLRADRFNGKDPEKLNPTRREQLIDEWTRSRGVTREELAIAMRRQAHLRRIAGERVVISEELLQREFGRVHGEKVEVRHIQLAAARFWPQVKDRLDRGERFEDLVASFSQNSLSREHGGLLPPFSAADDTVPPIFIEAAFRLEPGQITNLIEAEGSYHVLKLERRIPADNADFDDVRPALERHCRARIVAQEMEALGEKILQRSTLAIEDPTLREQYERARASGKLVGPPLAGR